MFAAIIRATAEIASFRIPETHTFQKTLSLPPYTTVVGMLGAAMGKQFFEIQEWVKKQKVQIGIRGSNEGLFRDLWKIQKITERNKEGQVVISAVLVREFLVGNSYSFVFGCKKEKTAQDILQAFLDPKFALSAGSSDNLLLVHSQKSCVQEVKEEPVSAIEGAIVPSDIFSEYTLPETLFDTPIVATLQPPEVHSLPYRFSEGKFGVREVCERKTFSFVGHEIRLNAPLAGVKLEEGAIIFTP